jgi:ATP-binding cassette subfamily B protein
MTWQEIYKTLRLGISRTWETSPTLLKWIGASMLVASLMPAGLAVLSGFVANDVKTMVENDNPDSSIVTLWLALAALILLVGGLCDVIRSYATGRLGDEMNIGMSREVLGHASSLDLAFFERKENHDILSRARSYPGTGYLQFVTATFSVASSSIQFISLLGVMLYIELRVTLVLTVVTVPFLLFRWWMAKLRFRLHRERTKRRRESRYYAGLVTQKNAIPTIKIFGLGPLLLDRYQKAMEELIDIDRSLYLKTAVGKSVVTIVYSAAFLVAVGWVAGRALEGAIGIGALVTYLASAIRFGGVSTGMVNRITGFMEKALFVRDLHEFMAIKPAIDASKGRELDALRGEIEFHGATFCYPGTENAVIENLNLRIRPGETVAVVGPNGAGKTTLVKLIARLYDLTGGSITIDGHDVRELSPAWLHQQMTYVGQEPVRFETTMEENLAFGDWKRLLGRTEEVREYAERAGLEKIIRDAPHGLKTRLGRHFGDHDLSGGQWQLLALARAVARNSPIVILDEPTSNLDAKAEYEVFERFHKISAGRTIILVSHRFSTVRMVDRIFVLDEGQIVEEGTHDELLDNGGVYAGLYAAHRARMDPEYEQERASS